VLASLKVYSYDDILLTPNPDFCQSWVKTIDTRNIVQARKQPRFFHGWIIVGIIFTTSMITAGISGWGLPFFLKPMSEEFGVSRGEFSTVTLFRLGALPLIPFLGVLADRKSGPRRLLVIGSLVAGCILIAVSFSQNIWHFFLGYGLLFSVAVFGIGGQLVGPAVLAKWFVRKRGRVMAISAIGISGGGLIIAPLAGWLVSEYGWRFAWVALGIIMILSIGPISALFMHRQPEDIGLLPDGVDPEAENIEGGQGSRWADSEYSWTRREALRTKALWVLLGVQTMGGIALMPTLLHQVAYIEDKGFSGSTAAIIATTLATFAIIGKLVYGYFSERYSIQWVVAACLIPAGLSLLILVIADSLNMLYAYAVLHGLSMGGWAPLMNVAWAVYFGRKHLGAIRGVVTPVGNIVGAVSPIFAGLMWDLRGSYDLPFTIFALSWVVGGLLMVLAKPPTPPKELDTHLPHSSH